MLVVSWNKSAEINVLMAKKGPNKTNTSDNKLFILVFWTFDRRDIKKAVKKLCFTITIK